MASTSQIWMDGTVTVDILVEEALTTDTYHITNEDIEFNGFVWNRGCASGEKLAFGECVASMLELTLMNDEGKFSNKHLEGAHLFPTIYATLGSETSAPVKLGELIVDNAPIESNRIYITAFDRMVQADKIVSPEDVATLLSHQCQLYQLIPLLGFELADGDALTRYPNATMVLTEITTEESFTARDMLRWICEYLGAVCYLDENGKLKVVRYPSLNEGTKVILSDKTSNVAIQSQQIQVKGVTIQRDDNIVRSGMELDGEADYTIDIVDNPLVISNPATQQKLTLQEIADNIFAKYLDDVTGTNLWYTPLDATLFSDPTIEPCQHLVVVVPQEGQRIEQVTTIATNITYNLNGVTTVTSIGKSATAEGWAANSIFSGKQKEMINKLVNAIAKRYGFAERDFVIGKVNAGVTSANNYTNSITEPLTDKVNAVDDKIDTSVEVYAQNLEILNRMAIGTLGAYQTAVSDAVGRKTLYWHDASTLANSKIVYKCGIDGLFWTDDYKGAETVWTRGITSSGDAVLGKISAWDISADKIKTGKIVSNNGKSTFNLDNGTLTIGEGHNTTTISQSNVILPTEVYVRSNFTDETLRALGVGGYFPTEQSGSKTALSLGSNTATEQYILIGNYQSTGTNNNVVIAPYGNTTIGKVTLGTVQNNLSVNGEVDAKSKLKVHDGSGNTLDVATHTSNGLYIGGNGATILPTTFGVYLGLTTAEANKVTDFVYKEETIASGGINWIVRRWHSGYVEMMFHHGTIQPTWTGLFSKSRMYRGACNIALPVSISTVYTSQMATCDTKYLLGRSYVSGNNVYLSLWGTEDEGTGNPTVNVYISGK